MPSRHWGCHEAGGVYEHHTLLRLLASSRRGFSLFRFWSSQRAGGGAELRSHMSRSSRTVERRPVGGSRRRLCSCSLCSCVVRRLSCEDILPACPCSLFFVRQQTKRAREEKAFFLAGRTEGRAVARWGWGVHVFDPSACCRTVVASTVLRVLLGLYCRAGYSTLRKLTPLAATGVYVKKRSKRPGARRDIKTVGDRRFAKKSTNLQPGKLTPQKNGVWLHRGDIR